jgi:hypothetical protein
LQICLSCSLLKLEEAFFRAARMRGFRGGCAYRVGASAVLRLSTGSTPFYSNMGPPDRGHFLCSDPTLNLSIRLPINHQTRKLYARTRIEGDYLSSSKNLPQSGGGVGDVAEDVLQRLSFATGPPPSQAGNARRLSQDSGYLRPRLSLTKLYDAYERLRL